MKPLKRLLKGMEDSNSMKKVAVCVFAAMVVSIGVTGAAAANQLAGCAFVDADSNGICDTCGTAHAGGCWGGCFVDANGDGVCDNLGTGCAFIDADGNGICDTCGTVHGASGWGRHYVDADGDGVCDNQGAGYGRSASDSVSARGQGHGGCGGRGRHGR